MHTFNYYCCCCCCWTFWLAFGRKIKLLLFSHENNTTGAPASAPSGTQCRREGAPSNAWRCVGVPYRWTVQEQLKVFFPPLKVGLIFCEDGCLWRWGQVILIHQWCPDRKKQRRWISCSSASCPFQKKVCSAPTFLLQQILFRRGLQYQSWSGQAPNSQEQCVGAVFLRHHGIWGSARSMLPPEVSVSVSVFFSCIDHIRRSPLAAVCQSGGAVVVTDVCPTFSRGLSIQSGLQYSRVGQPSHACSCQTATSTQLCG